MADGKHYRNVSKPRSGGAERASLYGMALVRPHGDKHMETFVTLTAPILATVRMTSQLRRPA